MKNGNGYWQPTKDMRAKGSRSVPCGKDGPIARTKAKACAERWRLFSLSELEALPPPRGSIAEAFEGYKLTQEWAAKAERTREEWERAWTHIGPAFGEQHPKDVTLEDISGFRPLIERRISLREAHRCIKIWRALWQVASAMRYCRPNEDPSFGVRNKEPERRQVLWTHLEVIRLAKTAWR